MKLNKKGGRVQQIELPLIVYDFNKPDFEDGLPRKRQVMTLPDRMSIAMTLVFGLIMVAGLLTLAQALLKPDLYVPCLIAAGCIALIPKFRGRPLLVAIGLFVVRPLVSLGAAVSAPLLLILGSRSRLQPLRTPVRAFCWSFAAFMSIDIVVGQSLGAPTPVDVLAWNPFCATLVGRVLGLLPMLAVWTAVHVGAIILLAAILTAAEILFERGFRPRILGMSADPPCIHLSDLHVTADDSPPIQSFPLSTRNLLYDVRRQVAAATGPIALTGDITDGGTREEWRLALTAIEAARAAAPETIPVLLVPGNHDLFPYMQEFAPKRSALGLRSRLVPLRKLRFLEAAARLSPQLKIADGPLLSDHLTANATTLAAFAAGEIRSKDVVDELWASCFPLHCVIGKQAFIILDTNRPAMSVITAAFGEVASPVWQRLEAMLSCLSKQPELQVIVLGHHHLYTPLNKRTLWQVKYLEIVSPRDLLKLLSQHADFYLHGHRHQAFKFKVDRLSIVSAPSMREQRTAHPTRLVGYALMLCAIALLVLRH